MVALSAVPIRLSVSEFLAWVPGTHERWQLIDGVPHATAPPTRIHGWLQCELGSLIRNHLRATGSPCSTIIGPGIVPRVLAEHNMRIPGLAVTCSPNDRDERALTDPVLIVEILSPSNQAATWTNVWAYTTIPSVQEILVLRTDRIAASLLRRLPDTTWPDRPTDITEGPVTLNSIAFSFPLRDLYETTHLQT
jgi:Uma2 family endonuclease